MRILALWLLLASPASAAFDDFGAGGRAPGMGNAFTAVADDLYALHYNPSGLAQLSRPQAGAAYSRLHVGLTDGSELGLSQVGYAHPIKGGSWGSAAGAWQRFALSDLYQEQTLSLGYARTAWQWESKADLLAGMSVKYLTRSFQRPPEAANACDQLVCNRGADPVLSGSTDKGAVDADLGLLYRFPGRLRVGLLAQHLARPDVGFAAKDALPLNLHLGLGYKSLWMNLAGELRMRPAPDGSTDRDFILAGERFFPSLEYGQLGLRSSLGFGSRQWRQLTAGLSYRINKLQLDYAFLMPIGTVKGTAGTHRVGMLLHFGAPAPEDELSRRLLREDRRRLASAEPAADDRGGLRDLRLASVLRKVEAGRFREAHAELERLAEAMSFDLPLKRLHERLGQAAHYYPVVDVPVEKWEVVLSSAIRRYVHGRDHEAVLLGSYALSLNPHDARLANLLAGMEEATGLKAERAEGGRRGLLDEFYYRAETAHNRGDQEKVLSILKDIMEIEASDLRALKWTGSAYFQLGRYAQALAAWEKAYALDTDPARRQSLAQFMAQAREKLAPPPKAAPAGGSPPSPQAASRPRPEGAAPAAQRDAQEIERLYQLGAEHYARGENLQAAALFMRILQIDPDNEQAKKALYRIRRRP